MKKLFYALSLVLIFAIGCINADAKTPARKGSAKAKTTAAAGVSKNAYGYADPTGHTYTCTLTDGSKFTFTFKRNDVVSVTAVMGKVKQTAGGYWDQSDNSISVYTPDGQEMMSARISDDGKTMHGYSVYNEEYNLRLVR